MQTLNVQFSTGNLFSGLPSSELDSIDTEQTILSWQKEVTAQFSKWEPNIQIDWDRQDAEGQPRMPSLTDSENYQQEQEVLLSWEEALSAVYDAQNFWIMKN